MSENTVKNLRYLKVSEISIVVVIKTLHAVLQWTQTRGNEEGLQYFCLWTVPRRGIIKSKFCWARIGTMDWLKLCSSVAEIMTTKMKGRHWCRKPTSQQQGKEEGFTERMDPDIINFFFWMVDFSYDPLSRRERILSMRRAMILRLTQEPDRQLIGKDRLPAILMVPWLGQTVADININNVGHTIERSSIMDLVEKDRSLRGRYRRKNSQNRNQGRQLRNGDVANMLPLGRTIHGRCFIEVDRFPWWLHSTWHCYKPKPFQIPKKRKRWPDP